MTEILVTGGTGALGSRLVTRLVAKGHAVRVLSRRANPVLPDGVRGVRGDLVSGEGLAEAVDGADVIVHCATGPRTVVCAGSGTPRPCVRTSSRRSVCSA